MQAEGQTNLDPPISRRFIILKNVIGKGTFGTVYRGQYSIETKVDEQHRKEQIVDVAIKCVLIDPQFKNREIQIANQISHPNIVKVIEAFQDQSLKMNEKRQIPVKPRVFKKNQKRFGFLVMEYMPKTLAAIIKENRAKSHPFNLQTALIIFKQILAALSYLDMKGISHRDIKPSNILINENSIQDSIRICDFGCAKKLKQNEKSLNYICSRFYRAPQLMFQCKSYTNKIDMWSAGCIFVEMVTSYPIFDGADNTSQLAKIIMLIGTPTKQDYEHMKIKEEEMDEINKVAGKGVRSWIDKHLKSKCEQQQKQLMTQIAEKMLVYSPMQRMSAKDALKYLDQVGV